MKSIHLRRSYARIPSYKGTRELLTFIFLSLFVGWR